MQVDSRKLVDGLTPPTFIDLDGTAYTGKLVSVVEAIRMQDTLNKALAAGLPADQLEAALTEILVGFGLPAEKVLKLPGDAFWEAMDSFFASHRRQTPTPKGPVLSAPEQTPPKIPA